MTRAVSALGVSGVCLLLLGLGCDDRTSGTPGSSASSALSDEPSPNASILPEPLGDKKGKSSISETGEERGETPPSPLVLPRAKPTPLPLREGLPEDDLGRGEWGTGYSLHGRFVWPAVQSSVINSGKKTPTWPQFDIELLRELPDQPARLRAVLASPVFSLAEGSELRMRADRLGAILVWPDQRSYRVLAKGTMSALLSDKRADRLPFLEPTVKQLESTTKLGREINHLRIETSLGTAELDLAQLSDLPFAAPLLCRLLLDMVRVDATDETCPAGALPIRLSVSWSGGGGFLFEVLGYKTEPRLSLDQFRMPPILPIFKQGELPPSDEYVLPEKLRDELFPIKRSEETFAPRPAPAPPHTRTTSSASSPEPTPPEAQLAADEIELSNTTTKPLIVQLDRVPYLWLEPGEERSIRVRGAAALYSAQDFWGHVQLEPGLVSPPSRVVFGPPVAATVVP